MKKRILFIGLVLLLAFLAACGNTTDIEDINEDEQGQENQVGTSDHADETNEEEHTSTNEAEEASSEPKHETITETGIYNGQADPHTIEIETKEGPTAFQLTTDAREDVEGLNPGDEVTYTYYKDDEQLVIESIKKSK